MPENTVRTLITGALDKKCTSYWPAQFFWDVFPLHVARRITSNAGIKHTTPSFESICTSLPLSKVRHVGVRKIERISVGLYYTKIKSNCSKSPLSRQPVLRVSSIDRMDLLTQFKEASIDRIDLWMILHADRMAQSKENVFLVAQAKRHGVKSLLDYSPQGASPASINTGLENDLIGDGHRFSRSSFRPKFGQEIYGKLFYWCWFRKTKRWDPPTLPVFSVWINTSTMVFPGICLLRGNIGQNWSVQLAIRFRHDIEPGCETRMLSPSVDVPETTFNHVFRLDVKLQPAISNSQSGVQKTLRTKSKPDPLWRSRNWLLAKYHHQQFIARCFFFTRVVTRHGHPTYGLLILRTKF